VSIRIHTKELVKQYKTRTVVNHVSVEVKQGEIVGLLGPNGAGKTTTFYMVVGLIKPDEGEVYLNDQNITNLPMYKRAQLGIGYLPQEASVFRKLSVEDNILAVLELTKLSRKQQKEKLESLLDEFRLQHVRKSNGDVLSGGERRRTEIARALAVNPKFILLDEPFAGIDPIAVEDIQAIVAKLKHKNIGILITDHNVTETLSICDRAYLLIEGKIFKHGTADELADDEQVKRLYLGRNFELKRKDWLLDDNKINEKPGIHSIIHSVQSAVTWCERLQARQKDVEHSIGYRYSNVIVDDDHQIRDFIQYLDELKTSLYSFAKEQNDSELIDKIQQLESSKTIEETKHDLNLILFLLHSRVQ